MTIEEYIASELEKQYIAYLYQLPWWCPICGVGGNYVGPRPPQDYLWPPPSHVCEKKETEIKGTTLTDVIFDEIQVWLPQSVLLKLWGSTDIRPDLPDEIVEENLKLLRPNNPLKYWDNLA